MKYACFLFLFTNVLWSQNLKTHQWKNRIIVIKADEKNRKLAESQFQLFAKEQQKLKDRKIVLYKHIANTYVFYNWKQEPKTINSDIPINGFIVSLIGLDGFQKYESTKLEETATFFKLIDTMPMRRQELKNQKKKND